MGVQTGSDLLGAIGWRKRLAQIRLAAVVLSSVKLVRGRSSAKELSLAGGDICNPSISRHGGVLLVAVRRPSYRIVGTRLRLAAGTTLESATYVITLDTDLTPVESISLDTADTMTRFAEARDGLEDPRIFSVGERLLCLWSGLSLGSKAPSRHHAGFDWDPDWSETTNTMVLAEIRGGQVVEAAIVPSPTGRTREKNWMPIDGTDAVGFVYYLADGQVLAAPPGTAGAATAVRTVPVPARARRTLRGWSGSSQAIPWDGGHLCVVHLALRGIPILSRLRPAVYLHRFVWLGANGEIGAMSKPFRFLGLGVEFCAGAVVDGEDLLLSFGVDDRRAFICRTPAARVRTMLRRVR